MYRVHEHAPGTYTASQMIAHHVFVDKVRFPAQLAESRARATDAATAEAVCSVQRNGVQIATMTFAASGQVATFADMSAAVSFDDGDYLTIVAPATPDSTLAGVAVTLFGERYL